MNNPSGLVIDQDGTDGYKFTFSTDDGKVVGHVSVAHHGGGHPDQRTPKQKLEAAKLKIKRLSEALFKAARE